MMKALFRQQGAALDISILAGEPAQDFITAHASILDSAVARTEMSDAMRRRLETSDYIFSGMKTFHELNEAFPSLIDDEGNRKPFERFLNDVRSIDETYNANYLRAEYNFVSASGAMAARWEQFAQDGDDYNIQYRTAGDGRVRPEHAKLDGITLPFSHAFWDKYFPPNGWNCRCTAVQVRKGKYDVTPDSEVYERASGAIRDKDSMFEWNAGKEGKSVPDYNPYTIRACRTCPIANGDVDLARNTPAASDICQACRLLRGNAQNPETRTVWGKGEIYVSKHVNNSDKDYNDLMMVARFFAAKGSTVHLTPKLSRPPSFEYKCVYGDLVGTRYEGKCPDLLIDGKRYEVESCQSGKPKTVFNNMMKRGLEQSDRLIIKRPNLPKKFMRTSFMNRIKAGKEIKEVWTMNENGELEQIW